MANPEFVGLITSIQATAETALGDLNAATSSAARDGLLDDEARRLQVAERSLRLLLMLADKTRGNLDFEEADILSDAVTSLRQRLESLPSSPEPNPEPSSPAGEVN